MSDRESNYSYLNDIVYRVFASCKYLEASGCGLTGLRQNLISNDYRCLGRCPTVGQMGNRCNLPRVANNWCSYHRKLCGIISRGQHAATDMYQKYTSVFNDEVTAKIYSYRKGEYVDELRNNEIIYALTNFDVFETWDQIMENVDITSFIESIQSLDTLLEMIFRFQIDAILRFINSFLCYHEGADMGHIRAMLSSEWIYTKLMRFVTGDNDYRMTVGVRFRRCELDLDRILDELIAADRSLDKVLNRGTFINTVFSLESIPDDSNPLFYSNFGNDTQVAELLKALIRRYRQAPKIASRQNFEQYHLVRLVTESMFEASQNLEDLTADLERFAESRLRWSEFENRGRGRTFSSIDDLLFEIVSWDAVNEVMRDY